MMDENQTVNVPLTRRDLSLLYRLVDDRITVSEAFGCDMAANHDLRDRLAAAIESIVQPDSGPHDRD
jgi:hypothetical protein